MAESHKPQVQGYLVGQVIAASVGALLLLVGDFAGFSYYDRYYGWRNGYVGLGSEYPSIIIRLLSTFIVLAALLALVLALYASLKSLQTEGEPSREMLALNAKKAARGGGMAAGLALLGGILFIIFSVLQEMDEWWFDSGFYGAFLGGLLVFFFAKLTLKRIES